MKYITTVLLIVLFSFSATAQLVEGQDFCNENEAGSYFPLLGHEKFILWADTYYTEINNGLEEIDGVMYNKFTQKWETGDAETLFLREEDGVIYQYEYCCEKETIRYDEKFKKGQTWKTADGEGEYKILSYQGELKTPYCKYENLMVIEANLSNVKFIFYYLKGHGYIGAMINNKTISCVAPSLKTDN